MPSPRKYTATEVKQFVDLVCNNPDISEDEIAGMYKLVKMLTHFEKITDAEIEAEVQRTCR